MRARWVLDAKFACKLSAGAQRPHAREGGGGRSMLRGSLTATWARPRVEGKARARRVEQGVYFQRRACVRRPGAPGAYFSVFAVVLDGCGPVVE